jgi:hypothetical protein
VDSRSVDGGNLKRVKGIHGKGEREKPNAHYRLTPNN